MEIKSGTKTWESLKDTKRIQYYCDPESMLI